MRIEESFSAEPQYSEYYGRRSSWERFRDDEGDDETGNDESFWIIDVVDGARYLDEWSGPDGRLVG